MDDLIRRQAVKDMLFNKRGVRIYTHNGEKLKRYAEIDLDDLDAIPSAQPELCGDVVSRNAIVQKLNGMDRYVSTELRLCDTDKKFPQNEVFIVDDVYEEIVEQLPSAQPFHNITMTDVLKYIDDMPEDVWLEFTECLRCRGWELQWCGGDFT